MTRDEWHLWCRPLTGTFWVGYGHWTRRGQWRTRGHIHEVPAEDVWAAVEAWLRGPGGGRCDRPNGRILWISCGEEGHNHVQ